MYIYIYIYIYIYMYVYIYIYLYGTGLNPSKIFILGEIDLKIFLGSLALAVTPHFFYNSNTAYAHINVKSLKNSHENSNTLLKFNQLG